MRLVLVDLGVAETDCVQNYHGVIWGLAEDIREGVGNNHGSNQLTMVVNLLSGL